MDSNFASVGKVLPAVIAFPVIAELNGDRAWVGVIAASPLPHRCLRRWAVAASSSVMAHCGRPRLRWRSSAAAFRRRLRGRYLGSPPRRSSMASSPARW
jgi:hypothetical protein